MLDWRLRGRGCWTRDQGVLHVRLRDQWVVGVGLEMDGSWDVGLEITGSWVSVKGSCRDQQVMGFTPNLCIR